MGFSHQTYKRLDFETTCGTTSRRSSPSSVQCSFGRHVGQVARKGQPAAHDASPRHEIARLLSRPMCRENVCPPRGAFAPRNELLLMRTMIAHCLRA
ncbi:Hypothetical protein NTJ_16110 [Nesidiocoris tenuis]|uniref:Uncharacterized protein n=1 Tax=Nesidiocoris tenuis TaxID=355587 RepID=A0ABN7BHJ9_9HEMI|nr:Hypothetical protein NTJ_16110 [Nesidiocoris tenuis]